MTGEVPTVDLDPAEFIAQAQTPPTTQDAMNQFLIVASRSPSTDWFPTFLINCFPWLFPFGRGGPNEVRKSKISEWELAGMYIRKSTRAFRSYEFVLAVYNIISRKTAGLHTYIRSTIGNNPTYSGDQPSVYDLIGRLTEQQLITAGEYLQARKQALRSNRPVPKPPMCLCTTKLDLKFWREMEIISAAMPHTKEHSDYERLVTYGFHYKFGKGTLFLTINPNDGTQVTVNFLCGNKTNEMPKLTLRLTQISQFPGALAMYHERVIEIIIKVLLGWDQAKGRPYPEGGVFGFTRAIHACSEGQARMSLHVHLIAFLYGHDRVLMRLANDPEGVTNLEKYLQSNIEATIRGPVGEFANILESCAVCNTCFELNKTAMGPARRVKAKGLSSEPKLLFCPACDKAFPVSKHIKDTISKLGGPIERTDIDKLIFNGKFSSIPEVNSMQKVAVANFNNGHDPLHRPTCLKSKKAQSEKKCRSNMPAKPEPRTYIRLHYASCGCEGEINAEADIKTIEEDEDEIKSELDPDNSLKRRTSIQTKNPKLNASSVRRKSKLFPWKFGWSEVIVVFGLLRTPH